MFQAIAIIWYAAFCGNAVASIMDTISFDAITTESPGDGQTYSIGWVKVFGCTEGHNPTESSYTYAHNGNSNYMKQIAPYAVSVKMVPSDQGVSQAVFENYAVFSKICSNPVIAVNHLKEASFTVNVNTLAYSALSNLNNWYGSTEAKERLANTCNGDVGILRSFTDVFYHACGNQDGIHITPASGVCEWEWEETFGTDIDVYFGFDASRNLMCDGEGTGGLAIIPPDHIGWLKLFDCAEGRGEEINGIHFNGDYSEAELRDYLQYAISIKILARGNLPGIVEESTHAVTAALCNPSVLALNNGKELSFELDKDNKITAYQDTTTWYGANAARARLTNSCYADPGLGGAARDIFNEVFYHACGNHAGIHITASNVCEWDYVDRTYRDIEVWIAYDVNQEKCCTDGGLLGACPSPS